MRNRKQMVYKLSEVQKGNGVARPVGNGLGPNRNAPRAGVCDCGLDNFLPRWTHWVVFVLTVCVRMYYISQPRSLWILHPDEIYQTIEGKRKGGGGLITKYMYLFMV